jgi:flagellar motor switch protein FliN/FliY
VKDIIHFIDLEKPEERVKELALSLESALTASVRQIAGESAFSTCTRMEKTDLQVVLEKATTTPISALEIAFDGALHGNALLIARRDELYTLGSLTTGVEAGVGDAVTPEVVDGSVRFVENALRTGNTNFGKEHGKTVHSSAPELLNPDGQAGSLLPLRETYQRVLCITFQLVLGPQKDFRIQVFLHNNLLQSLMELLSGSETAEPAQGTPDPQADRSLEDKMADSSRGGGKIAPPPSKRDNPGGTANWNMDLLLDVELPIVVSFGTTEMLLKDVLKLGVGSVIELEKTVNDPVTLIVNQKPIARGEVVMVEGNYGVRILEVESTAERIRSLG